MAIRGERMDRIVMGMSTHYEEMGMGKQVVILLHGWGMDHMVMRPFMEHLETDFRVISFDLPGFGKSSEMDGGWSVFEYAQWLYEACEQLQVRNPILIAHSFGCRIALWFSLVYPVKAMVLMGAAGIKSKKNKFQKWQEIEYHIIKYVYRFLKQDQRLQQLQNRHGSLDYRQASVNMRKTLVKCIHLDLTPYLSSISAPTLVIMGENDTVTPVWMGQVMEDLMMDAALIVFDQGDHFACFQQSKRLFRILDVFLQKEEPKC
ncbi:MAG: alpha/beta hydrolase [Erysipelotrichaceae bacterium]|nr:alpha/beta hydrolase [Erysipelotrichaceae bacterium]